MSISYIKVFKTENFKIYFIQAAWLQAIFFCKQIGIASKERPDGTVLMLFINDFDKIVN